MVKFRWAYCHAVGLRTRLQIKGKLELKDIHGRDPSMCVNILAI